MQKLVYANLSPRSPYSYFATPRLRRLARHPEVYVRFRLVRPGVLRIPETYAHRGRTEQEYFELDIARTAAFPGIEFTGRTRIRWHSSRDRTGGPSRSSRESTG